MIGEYLEQIWAAIRKTTHRAEELGVVGSAEHLLGLDEHAIELAYAVILVDFAMIDNEFDLKEKVFIEQKLEMVFNIPGGTSRELVERAKEILGQDLHPESFATYLRQHLSLEKRNSLLENIDKLINVDRFDHPLEEDLKTRYQKLLLGKP
ncbi:MAG: TerB family tellurite resistance protein [Bdellovibrionales bacterium]|nr:TerB family tellurite resistance protein [Bdellovibrionales bacterium]